ncbi:MAG: hypothetical protein OXC84_05560 [Gammaproteobacteria bacterium]|nr:hypothetical protein [Gammaproteobacteria bacterium]
MAKIASSQTAFDKSVEALVALSENEVVQEVLAAMLAAQAAATDSKQGPMQFEQESA